MSLSCKHVENINLVLLLLSLKKYFCKGNPKINENIPLGDSLACLTEATSCGCGWMAEHWKAWWSCNASPSSTSAPQNGHSIISHWYLVFIIFSKLHNNLKCIYQYETEERTTDNQRKIITSYVCKQLTFPISYTKIFIQTRQWQTKNRHLEHLFRINELQE